MHVYKVNDKNTNILKCLFTYLYSLNIHITVSWFVFVLTSNCGGRQKAKQSKGAFSASWRVCGRCWFNVSGRSRDEVPPIINIVPIIMSGSTNMSVPCEKIINPYLSVSNMHETILCETAFHFSLLRLQ